MHDRAVLRRATSVARFALLLPLAVACAHQPVERAVEQAPARSPGAPLALVEIGRGLPRSGQWRNGFDLADVDGDGVLDLVHGPARKGRFLPVIFLGDGAGGFERWTAARFPALPYDYGDVAVADFDGDGRNDLAFGMHLRGIIALRALGGGAFEDFSQGLPRSGAGRGFSSRAIEAADWDGDGRPDLIAFGEGPSRFGSERGSTGLRVYLNRGASWQEIDPGRPTPSFGDALALADLDGDGRIDAVTSAGGDTGREVLHLNRGHAWESVALESLRDEVMVGAVAAGHVDGDDRADIALGYLSAAGGAWHAGIDLFLGRERGFERRELLREEGKNRVAALAAADLDGDGSVELVALRGDGTLQVLRVRGGAVVLSMPPPEWRLGCSGYGLRLADLDRDGRLEIIASFAGEGAGLGLEPSCPSGGGMQAWTVSPVR